MWNIKTCHFPPLQVLSSPPAEQVKFILDFTSNPVVISLYQTYGETVIDLTLYLTRTWAYSLHRQKLILSGKWPPETQLSRQKQKSSIYSGTCAQHKPDQTKTTDLLKTNTFCVSGDVPPADYLMYDSTVEAVDCLVQVANLSQPCLDLFPQMYSNL